MENTVLKQKQMNWKYQEQQKCWLLEQVVYCNNPENIEEMVYHIAAKLLEPFGIEAKEYRRWNGLQ